jgi:hypothetical protein
MIKHFLLISICFIALACNTPSKTEEIKNDGVSPASPSVSGVFATNLKLGEGKFKIISKGSSLLLTIPIEVIKPYETNQKWEQKASEDEYSFNDIMLYNYGLDLNLLDSNNAPFTVAGSFKHSVKGEFADALLRGSGLVYVDFFKSYSEKDSLTQKADFEMLAKNAVKFTVLSSLDFDDSMPGQSTSSENNLESESNPIAQASAASSSSCQQWLKDYDSWVTNYISFMRKYKKNPGDMSMLSDYTRLTSEMSKWSSGNSGCNDAASVSRLTQIANRMNRELASL